MNRVFVYGIFINKNIRIRAFGHGIKTISATLKDYKLSIHSRGYFANIIPQKDSLINSLVMEITDDQLNYLDKIEHINTGLYKRITVNTSIGECFVYLE